MQDDISLEISRNLRQSLTGEERRRVVKHGTGNSESYELWLKGAYYHRKESVPDYVRALNYYRQAIDKDPSFALPYSGLADLYSSRAYAGDLPPKEASEKARAAASRAIEIDPSLPQVEASQAIVAWLFDWDWVSAQAACQRALAVKPGASVAYFVCGQFSTSLGRFDEAIARMKEAEESDPLSVETSRSLGTTYYWARRYDDAIAQFRKALEMAPQESSLYDRLADVYERKGMFKDAIAALQQSILLAGSQLASLESDPKEAAARRAEAKEDADGLGEDFKAHGFETVIRQLYQANLNASMVKAGKSYVSPVKFAVSYARLGEPDKAFEWLEKGYGERSPWLVNLKTDPAFDSLRSDPRFAVLLQKVGLPKDP